MAETGEEGATRQAPLPPAQQLAEIQAHVAPLAPLGCNLAVFTPESINNLGMTTDAYMKQTKVLMSVRDAGTLKKAVTAAIRAKLAEAHSDIGVREALTISKWMKTQEGSRTVQTQGKLEKTDGDDMTPEEAGLVQALDTQFRDFRAKMKETRAKYDAELAKLRKRISEVEACKEISLKRIRGQYAPASDFNEPEAQKMGSLCYGLYKEECEKKGDVAIAPSSYTIDTSVKLYADEVRKRKMAEFIRLEHLGPWLMGYLEEEEIQRQ